MRPLRVGTHGLEAPEAAAYESTHAEVVGPSYQSPLLDCSMSLPAQIVTSEGMPWAAATRGAITDVNRACPCAVMAALERALPGTAAVRLLLVPIASTYPAEPARCGLTS